DPPNCQTGVQLDLKVFRADGTTPAQGGEVSPCETLKYQITLTDPPGRCAFQGGKLFVIFPTRACTGDADCNDAPNGTCFNGSCAYDVTPGVIPCLGGTGLDPSCPAGNPSVDSTVLTIQLGPQFGTVGTQVPAVGSYGLTSNGGCIPPPPSGATCGTAHNNATDTPNSVSGTIPASVTEVPCPPRTPCQDSFCNPTKTNGVSTGLCDTLNEPDSSTPSGCSVEADAPDNDLCTHPGCLAGVCEPVHTRTDCPTDQCNQGCNPTTGLCTPAPPSTSPCTPAGPVDPCQIPGCEIDPANAQHGICVAGHLSQPDSSTPPGCSAEADKPDNDLCTHPGCLAGHCEPAHTRTPCATHPCNQGCSPTTGLCTPTPASTSCTPTGPVDPCQIPGCEIDPANAQHGICVAGHLSQPDSSTPPGCSAEADKPDNDLCTHPGCLAGHCEPAHTRTSCTTDQCNQGCSPTTGLCTPVPPSTTCTPTGTVDPCQMPGCEIDPANAKHGICVASHMNKPDSTTCPDTTTDNCTAGCEAGHCVQTHMCRAPEICRTPGFFGTHGGKEKPRSQNITQALINAAGGCLNICGEIITNTTLNSADSAVEALCVSVRGDPFLQLVRQLTAASLNCVLSNGNSDCTGVSVQDVFQTCN